MLPEVIYKDKNFLAVNKPAGLLTHQVSGIKRQAYTLVDWLLEKYPEIKTVGDDPKTRPGIIHRLDKDTSGVILIAKNQRYFEYLKKLLQTQQIKKTYLALVYGEVKPEIGEIKKPIFLKAGGVKRTVWKGKMEKEAITEYKVIKSIRYKVSSIKEEVFSLLRVFPKTGRTHQIRVHLSSIGHPIVGDKLYGPKENPFDLSRQFLHAESLEFNLSSGRRIKIEAELPEELKKIIDDLRNKM